MQYQRRAVDTPPKRTDHDWCRMYIAAFYKAKLLRGVPLKLQDDFEVFLRSLGSVFIIDGDDIPATSTHQWNDRADPPLSASGKTTPHSTRSSSSGIGSPRRVWARRLLLYTPSRRTSPRRWTKKFWGKWVFVLSSKENWSVWWIPLCVERSIQSCEEVIWFELRSYWCEGNQTDS
jgi:hypothetical protein